MLVNCTNHPVAKWEDTQVVAAERFGKIIDLPFPAVYPYATTNEIVNLADLICKQIIAAGAATVLCQGEATLTFQLVSKLKSKGIKVIAACSRRQANTEMACGTITKLSVYKFIQFREY